MPTEKTETIYFYYEMNEKCRAHVHKSKEYATCTMCSSEWLDLHRPSKRTLALAKRNGCMGTGKVFARFPDSVHRLYGKMTNELYKGTRKGKP